MTKKRSRGRRIVRWTLGIVGGLLVAAVIGIVVYSQVGVMAAEPEPLAAVRADEVGAWMVGGHSLGGVKACQLASDARALVLFASYCANDLSASETPVLSLSGSEDGLSTPQKIADARHRLPADAVMVEIPGASHASFGDYGPQSGDGTPTATDAEVEAVVVAEVRDLAAHLP